jgi:hypothetical protein
VVVAVVVVEVVGAPPWPVVIEVVVEDLSQRDETHTSPGLHAPPGVHAQDSCPIGHPPSTTLTQRDERHVSP